MSPIMTRVVESRVFRPVRTWYPGTIAQGSFVGETPELNGAGSDFGGLR